ncbi:MAG TPA: hypothetical protein VF767_00545 [Bryobacteraceae bacterium]
MRYGVLALLVLSAAAPAEERWTEARSGPFQVLSNAGERPARDTLNLLEQVRYEMGVALGKEDLKAIWPIRVVIGKMAAVPPALMRDSYMGALTAGGPVPPGWLRGCVRLLLDSNAGRMPYGIEAGLVSFYSTAQAAGTKVTLGTPPPESERNLDWARVYLLVTDPAYAGRLKVLLFNLQRGADPEPAFRNAFSKSAAEVEKQAEAVLAAGRFETVTVGGRPLNPARDFLVRTAAAPLPAIAMADVGRTAAAYQAIASVAPAEAHEGLGFVALGAKREDDARREFNAAIAAGSASARAWFEAARLEPDAPKARADLQKAAELNTSWAEPYKLLAVLETDPSRQLEWLKRAAALEPRSSANWRAVAELYQKHNKYPEAVKAWNAAEDAAADPGERERIHEARRDIAEKRLEYEIAERKRLEEERERDLRRVKDAAMAEVHAAEERANRSAARANPSGKLEQMEIGEAPAGKVKGEIARIDCLGRMARLVVRTGEGTQMKLLVRDPKSVVVLSGGELSLACGVQRPPRAVSIEYQPAANAKLGTAGDVVAVSYE